MTLREHLEAEVSNIETQLAAKKSALENLKAQGVLWLEHDVETVKSWLETLKAVL